MYNALIVDDEPWAINGIKRVFNFDEIGIKVVKETTNPRIAVNTLLSENIDVVFSDIRMPEISGLDLMRTARENSLDTEFIFISGYADFQYAQDALKLGAFDFCLKPIPFDVAHSAINKLISHLETKKIDKDIETFESLYENRSDFELVLKERKLDFDKKFYRVITINLINSTRNNAILTLPDCAKYLYLYLGSGRHIFIINYDNFFDFQDTLIPELVVLKAFCGLSSVSEDNKNISKLIMESTLASGSEFIYKGPKVVEYSTNSECVKVFLEKLYNSFDISSFRNVKELLSNIPDYFAENQLGMGDAIFLWNQIAAYVSYKYSHFLVSEYLFFCTYEILRQKFANIYELCEYLIFILEPIFSSPEPLSNSSHINENIKLILEYINSNYKNELYLKDISNTLHLNFNYISTLFKKSMGITFSEYLTDIRLKKACELLQSTQLSIEEVCHQTGYNDYYHFNKSFKKRYGIPPGKFRSHR